ncbi:hypothetical protein VTN31DRAFT_2161 [Thermomyces dupontii]|uniref:uncharacterized protein n=1 Tax=Talaromyces thermophilus TaxID=28565 RepID=UPI0037444265
MVETSAQKQTASTTATNAPANVRVNTSVQYPSIAVHQSALPTESHTPIKNPQRVIDLATGTSIWVMDFVDQHPQAEVIGCDLSQTQLTKSVKPGGWVEFQGLDGYPDSEDGSYDATGLQRYYNEVYGAFEKGRGRVCRSLRRLAKGGSPPHLKKVGAWNQAQAETHGYEAAALAPLTRLKNWTKEEVILLANQARAHGRKRNIHMMFDLTRTVGGPERTLGSSSSSYGSRTWAMSSATKRGNILEHGTDGGAAVCRA